MQVVEGMPGADRDDRAPLRELRAELHVLLAALRELVEALGDLLVGAEREVGGAGIDLDPGQDALAREQRGERRAVGGLLAQRLVVQDHAAHVVAEPAHGEQQLAIGAAVLLGVLDLDRLEALADGAGRLVGGEDAAAARDHGLGDFGEFAHDSTPLRTWRGRFGLRGAAILPRGPGGVLPQLRRRAVPGGGEERVDQPLDVQRRPAGVRSAPGAGRWRRGTRRGRAGDARARRPSDRRRRRRPMRHPALERSPSCS